MIRRRGTAVGYGRMGISRQTDTLLEKADRYEITVYLIRSAPKDECTVNITLRRCRTFKPMPGTKLKWTNSRKSGSAVGGDARREIQSGEVTADKWGLVTLEQVKVTKAGNRIKITR